MSNEKRYTPSVSLNEDQRDWIKKQAEKEGISYTHYMRKVVLGALPQAEKPFYEEDQPVPVKKGMTHRELGRILNVEMPKPMNNLNQIARRLNSGQPVDDKMLEMMKDVRKNHGELARKILKILR